ncbi:MAG: Unknown protein [uncultured Sulfurovum sp.]|uniref:Uncharacterized protein n=1 Tax=uncultured Sulfurovum sp. TaxID=269237 RepID=A0A6S6SM86_9BACT|nr:MAG: Unknown protein [uncultured Sulfurovum sp.]
MRFFNTKLIFMSIINVLINKYHVEYYLICDVSATASHTKGKRCQAV